jgi:ApeA N-terminal domain 1
MANVVEDRGFFWWWGFSPDSPVSGLLKVDNKGQITLELDQELPEDGASRPLMDKARGFPEGSMIAGRLSKSGEFVLLNSLRLTKWSWSATPIKPESYVADTCLIGHGQFEQGPSVLQFRHLRIDLRGLNDWLNLDAITSTMINCDEDSVEFSVKYKRQKFSSKMPDFDLFVETVTTNPTMLFDLGPRSEAVFRQETWLQYETHSGSNLASIQEDFTRLEEFFALLMGSYPHFDWPFVIQGIEPDERWYKLYFFRGSPSDFEPNLNNTLTWFYWSRDSLGELFASSKIKREQYGPGYYLHLAALRNPSTYVEHRFVNLIWALESLHRRKNRPGENQPSSRVCRILQKFIEHEDRKDLKWLKKRLKYADEPSLEMRIIESFTSLPLDIPQEALHKFAKRCADRRNQISHNGGPLSDETYAEFHQDLIYLTEAFKYLYHALLLDEIGFDRNRLKEAFTYTFIAKSRILPSFQIVGLVPESKSVSISATSS